MNDENVGPPSPPPQQQETDHRERQPGEDELTGDEGGAGHYGQHSGAARAAMDDEKDARAADADDDAADADDDVDDDDVDDDAIDPDRSTD